MRIVRPSSYDEYVCWYLRREARKRRMPMDPESSRTTEGMREEMKQKHTGKLRHWFETGSWHIVELDNKEELFDLVCLDSPWTRGAELLDDDREANYRILKVVVKNARQKGYYCSSASLDDEERQKRMKYLEEYRCAGRVCLRDDDRIVLRTLNHDERTKNPSGTYYLHDGLGRLLAYSYLLTYKGFAYCPVEAFLAEPVCLTIDP